MSPGPRTALCALLVALAGGPAATAEDRAAPTDRVVAVLPLKNRAGDAPAAFAVEQALGAELRQRAEVVAPGRARRALRRLRIRDGDVVTAARMIDLGRLLGADFLVTGTLHDAERRDVARMTVSVRAYSGATGELLWVGFTGGSGIDHRGAFERGVIGRVEGLAPVLVRRLMDDLFGAALAGGQAHDRARATFADRPGPIAVVPVDSVTLTRSTANAETVTEAVRTALHRGGFETVSPGCTGEVIRRRQAGVWGGVGAERREGLREDCGAVYVVTGAVETYDVDILLGEPEPLVFVALRVVDVGSGKILWTGELDRGGWDSSGLLRLGRTHSRGALAEEMTGELTRRMRRELFGEGRR